MQRPTGITATTILMYGMLTLEIVHVLHHGTPHPSATATRSAEQLRHGIYIVECLAWSSAAIIYFFYWKGQDAARWLVIFGSGLGLVALRSVRQTWQTGAFTRAQIVINSLLDVFLLVYLNTPKVRAWFYASRLRWRNRSRYPLT